MNPADPPAIKFVKGDFLSLAAIAVLLLFSKMVYGLFGLRVLKGSMSRSGSQGRSIVEGYGDPVK